VKNGSQIEENKLALHANVFSYDGVNRSPIKAPTKWQPPPPGATKLNFDAAFCNDSGEAVVGVVARDHRGAIVMAASKVLDRCKDVEEAETCVVREGLKLAMDNNLELALLES
jgi:hypothetical protein